MPTGKVRRTRGPSFHGCGATAGGGKKSKVNYFEKGKIPPLSIPQEKGRERDAPREKKGEKGKI